MGNIKIYSNPKSYQLQQCSDLFFNYQTFLKIMQSDGTTKLQKKLKDSVQLTQQLYNQFNALRQLIKSNSNRKNSSNKKTDSNNKADRNKNKNKHTKQKASSLKRQQNYQVQQHQPEQTLHLRKKFQLSQILNTPQPVKKWAKIKNIQTNQINYSNDSKMEGSQERQKNGQSQYRLRNLIEQYSDLYEYSIKKVIQNSRKIKKRRKINESHVENTHQMNSVDIKKQNGEQRSDENVVQEKSNQNKQEQIVQNANLSKNMKWIVRKLDFSNIEGIKKIKKSENQNHEGEQKQKSEKIVNKKQLYNYSHEIDVTIEQCFNKFQSNFSAQITKQQQRLLRVASNLDKIKLSISNSIKKNIRNYQKINSQKMVLEDIRLEENAKIIKQNQKQTQNHPQKQQLEFNEFNQQYIPDDSSSIYSQNPIQDFQFDQEN